MKKRILSVLLCISMAAAMMTGCSGSTKNAKKTEEKTEEKEKVFTMAIKYMPDSLVPFSGNSFQTTMVRPIYEQLYLDSSEGRDYILAKSFEVSDDGLTYTLRMNQEATWSDGEPITVKDILFAIDYQAIRSSKSGLKQINGKEVVFNEIDDYTLEIVLPEIDSTYSGKYATMTPMPSHLFDNDATKVDGSAYFTEADSVVTSGPYKVSEINSDSIVYVARDDYFRGKPAVDKIVLKMLGEGVSEQIAFENGELSYIRLESAEDIEKYESQPDKYNMYTLSESRTGYMQLNPKGPVMSTLSEDARKAIFLALNIEEIIDIAHGSDRLAVPAKSIMNPDQIYFDKDCEGYVQDLEQAKKLAKSSGLEGKTLTYVYCSDRVNMKETATVVQQQLAEIGVTLELKGLDTSSFFQEFFYPYMGGEGDTWDLGTNGWGDMRGNRVAEQLAYFTNPAWGWSNEFTELSKKVYLTTDEDKLMELWKEIQAKILDEYWEYPMEYSKCAMVSQKNVTGLDECTIVPEFADWMKIRIE